MGEYRPYAILIGSLLLLFSVIFLFSRPEDFSNTMSFVDTELHKASEDEKAVKVKVDLGQEEQLTLWGQKGSQVIRGNLLVVPIEKSILYVEPIYLQAERGRLPELKRVIVASGDRIAMELTLAESLSAIYASLPPEEPPYPIPHPSPVPPPSPPSPPAEAPLVTEISELAKLAQEHYNKAQEYLKADDWTGWGEELKKMEEALNKLEALTTK